METETITPEEVAARNEQVVASMREAGVSVEEYVEVDYFGVDERERVPLAPRSKQWVEIKALTEGDRVHYMNMQSRDVTIEKVTGNAKLKMATGEERHALLKSAITGWHLLRRRDGARGAAGEMIEVPFNKNELELFLQSAPPKVIDVIEKAVRNLNPWLGADITIEDIDEQIRELTEMRERKVREAAGN